MSEKGFPALDPVINSFWSQFKKKGKRIWFTQFFKNIQFGIWTMDVLPMEYQRFEKKKWKWM